MRRILLGLGLFLAAGGPVAALPVLGSEREIAGVKVYSDHQSSTRFYYAPGKLSIPKDAEGRPDIHFLQTRYTGSAVTGDQGQFRTRSSLKFRVRMEPVDGARVAAVRLALRRQYRFFPELRPLPVRQVESTLNYVPLKDSEA